MSPMRKKERRASTHTKFTICKGKRFIERNGEADGYEAAAICHVVQTRPASTVLLMNKTFNFRIVVDADTSL